MIKKEFNRQRWRKILQREAEHGKQGKNKWKTTGCPEEDKPLGILGRLQLVLSVLPPLHQRATTLGNLKQKPCCAEDCSVFTSLPHCLLLVTKPRPASHHLTWERAQKHCPKQEPSQAPDQFTRWPGQSNYKMSRNWHIIYTLWGSSDQRKT